MVTAAALVKPMLVLASLCMMRGLPCSNGFAGPSPGIRTVGRANIIQATAPPRTDGLGLGHPLGMGHHNQMSLANQEDPAPGSLSIKVPANRGFLGLPLPLRGGGKMKQITKGLERGDGAAYAEVMSDIIEDAPRSTDEVKSFRDMPAPKGVDEALAFLHKQSSDLKTLVSRTRFLRRFPLMPRLMMFQLHFVLRQMARNAAAAAKPFPFLSADGIAEAMLDGIDKSFENANREETLDRCEMVACTIQKFQDATIAGLETESNIYRHIEYEAQVDLPRRLGRANQLPSALGNLAGDLAGKLGHAAENVGKFLFEGRCAKPQAVEERIDYDYFQQDAAEFFPWIDDEPAIPPYLDAQNLLKEMLENQNKKK